MYEARIIGTEIVAVAPDLVSAYNLVRVFDRTGRVSMRFVPMR